MSGTPGFTPMRFSFAASTRFLLPPFGTWYNSASSGVPDAAYCAQVNTFSCSWSSVPVRMVLPSGVFPSYYLRNSISYKNTPKVRFFLSNFWGAVQAPCSFFLKKCEKATFSLDNGFHENYNVVC